MSQIAAGRQQPLDVYVLHPQIKRLERHDVLAGVRVLVQSCDHALDRGRVDGLFARRRRNARQASPGHPTVDSDLEALVRAVVWAGLALDEAQFGRPASQSTSTKSIRPTSRKGPKSTSMATPAVGLLAGGDSLHGCQEVRPGRRLVVRGPGGVLGEVLQPLFLERVLPRVFALPALLAEDGSSALKTVRDTAAC